MIATLMIVRDATIWSVSLGLYLMTLAKAKIFNCDHNCIFIVLATVIMIVNYDRKTFIVQQWPLL